MAEWPTAVQVGDTHFPAETHRNHGLQRLSPSVNRTAVTAHYYSAAMLEKLVYLGEMPPNQHFIVVKIPQGTSCEFVNPNDLPGWSDSTREQSRAFGSKWYNECRSAILVVPNVIARMENNVLINPEHEDAVQIKPEPKMPVLWDRRLFKR